MPTKFENDLLEGLRDAVAHASSEHRPGRRLHVVQVHDSDLEPDASRAAKDDQDRHDG